MTTRTYPSRARPAQAAPPVQQRSSARPLREATSLPHCMPARPAGRPWPRCRRGGAKRTASRRRRLRARSHRNGHERMLNVTSFSSDLTLTHTDTNLHAQHIAAQHKHTLSPLAHGPLLPQPHRDPLPVAHSIIRPPTTNQPHRLRPRTRAALARQSARPSRAPCNGERSATRGTSLPSASSPSPP